MKEKHIIGSYQGSEDGPLLIALGGMHGNETAGVVALETFFEMLKVEPEVNPEFEFHGRFLALRGNPEALKEGRRYHKQDLNRMWTPETVKKLRRKKRERLRHEQLALINLIELVETEIEDYQPERVIVLDLHTTTATGGIFSIPTNDVESLRIAVELHAPVIKGLLRGVRGTTLHYFNEENLGVPTVPVTFEGGQHNDPLSVNRCIAAITNCMRTIGMVKAEHVENRHDALLKEYSANLPKIAELIMCHRIEPDDHFRMMPNYHNFQPVTEGEKLAEDRYGEIRAATNGQILMPLYQPQGDDGFFLIRTLEFF